MKKKSFRPSHKENKMKNEGNVIKAREDALRQPSNNNNLKVLLSNRYLWMNEFIKEYDTGVEVGAGTGLSKLYIKCNNFLLTDFTDNEWLDVKNVDALATPFKDGQMDFVISSNMIHHVPYPVRFMEEMRRILKPGGYLLIQEINCSLATRFILRLMKHEGYDYPVDVFDSSVVCTNPDDLWSANCAIPNMLFDDQKRFEKEIEYFKIVKTDFSELFLFLNSGGVIAKTVYVPLPFVALYLMKIIDDLLSNTAPSIFAMQRQIALKKVK